MSKSQVIIFLLVAIMVIWLAHSVCKLSNAVTGLLNIISLIFDTKWDTASKCARKQF